MIAIALLTRPTLATKVALNCLKIPIITKIMVIHYVDSWLPKLRKHIFSQGHKVINHPIDLFYARPLVFKSSKFFDYHKDYVAHKHLTLPPWSSSLMGNYGNIVENKKIFVRFIEYCGGH